MLIFWVWEHQNFFKLLHEETDCSAAGVVCPSFTEFFGAIDLMPLGPGIQIILPLLLGALLKALLSSPNRFFMNLLYQVF
jgi:hypothetical protein